VDARELAYLTSLVGPGAVEGRAPDGSARLRFQVADEAGFVSFVLGCGDALEVIEPARLRGAVVDALERAAHVAPGTPVGSVGQR